MRSLLLLLALTCAHGQNLLSITATPQQLKVGDTAQFTVSLTPDPAHPTSAISWFNLQSSFAGVSLSAPVTGAAALGANKTTSCSSSLPMTCIVSAPDFMGGLNNTPLSTPGPLLTFPITFTAAFRPSSFTITLVGVVAGDTLTGQGVPISSGASATVKVLASVLTYDLNGDGLVNVLDVVSAIGQVIGTATCSTADVNGDAHCDALDVILIIRSALGL